MRQSIFVVSGSGDLVRMRPSAPPDEDSLQELIARHPDIIGDSDTSLLLVQREQPFSDAEGASGRWSLDHLFVTRDAIPVLVEVKRAVDTRLRREVVGQMLDYAANGVAYWPTGTIAEVFANTCEKNARNADEILGLFLGGQREPDEFWSQVDANFRAGRIKLVFVADTIPRELARIVEFLNEQMTADVRAVELQYFEGDGGVRTLSPRVIGETERAQAQKSVSRPRLAPISEHEWIGKHIAPLGEEVLISFQLVLRIMRDSGARIGIASTQGSIYAEVNDRTGKARYPFYLLKNGTGQVSFGYAKAMSELAPTESRQGFYDRFADAVGQLSNRKLDGYPTFKLQKLNDTASASAFRDVLVDWLGAFERSEPISTSS